MSKGKVTGRRRPHIHDVQHVIKKDEYRTCSTPTCKNVIARESGRTTCSRCKN